MQRDGQYLQSIGSNNMHYNRSTAICSRSGCKGMEEGNASYFSLQGTETRCDSDIKKMDTKLNRDHKEIKEKKRRKGKERKKLQQSVRDIIRLFDNGWYILKLLIV